MRTLRAVITVGALVVPAALAVSGTANAAATPVVMHLATVTRQLLPPQPDVDMEVDTTVEPDVAVSPIDPRIAVAVAQEGRFTFGSAAGITYAWTHDAGATWQPATLPGLTRPFASAGTHYVIATDPTVAFGPDGTVYAASLLAGRDCRNALSVSRSTDGGRTFAAPTYAQDVRDCGDDKPWLTVDTGRASPHRGRLYMFWTRFPAPIGGQYYSPQAVRWSDDQGQTWSSTHYVTESRRYTQGSEPLIRADGSIVDTYVDYSQQLTDPGPRVPVAPIYARISADGGATWGHEYLVTTGEIGGTPDIRSGGDDATIDQVTGTMYVVWTGIGPGNTNPIELTSSSDGINWSAPVRVTRNDVPGIERVNMDVSALAGRVFVTYGTRTHADQNGGRVQQQLSWSDNGGLSFSQPISIGPVSLLAYGARSEDGEYFPGDYIGSAIAPGHLYIVWPRASKPSSAATTPYHQVIEGAELTP